MDCKECKGRGTVEEECSDCRGTGEDCPHCGRGECDICSGSGLVDIDCEQCKGSGEAPDSPDENNQKGNI